MIDIMDEQQELMTAACDECGETLTVPAPSWRAGIENLKAEGWTVRPEEGLKGTEFRHLCSLCTP